MRTKLLLWLVVLCLLPSFSVYAQGSDPLTWTVGELAGRYTLGKDSYGLPVYKPQRPEIGAAIYVDLALSEKFTGGAERSLEVRNYIAAKMGGTLRWTDDPDRASIMIGYKEAHHSKGDYKETGGSGRTIEVFSSYAGLYMLSLTGEGARSHPYTVGSQPEESIVTSARSEFYMPVPDATQCEEMVRLLSDLKDLCALPLDYVMIGTNIVLRDAKSLSISPSDDMYKGSILNLERMAMLTQLEEVTITGHTIEDISALVGLTKLKKLELVCRNKKVMEGVSALSGLAELEELTLTGAQLTDISPLAGLRLLRELDLSSNEITDISPLAGLTALRELKLSHNQITDISPLACLTALQKLDLWSNQVTDFSPLAGLASLRELGLAWNQITDLSTLSGPVQLQSLELRGNQITDLSPLSGFVQLQSLELSENQVTKLAPLSGLVELRYLGLSRNEKLKDISKLNKLTNLEELLLFYTKVPDRQVGALRKKLPDCFISHAH